MVIALHCEQGRHCSGVGDRMKSLQTAFWMVRLSSPLPASRAVLRVPPMRNGQCKS